MCVRRVLLCGIACALLFRAACVHAADPSDQPILGHPEPIGKLLVVTAAFDASTDAPPPAPLRLLPAQVFSIAAPLPGTPCPSDFAESGAYSLPTVGVRTGLHPIELHLSSAVHHLFAAGLTDESQQVNAVLLQFQTQYRQRVQLAEKQVQLAALQAEVERLKLRVEKGIVADQVSISIKVFETDDGEAEQLTTRASSQKTDAENEQAGVSSRTLNGSEFQDWMDSLKERKKVRILSEPQLVVLSGQTGRVTSGGFTAKGLVPALQAASANETSPLSFGTSVLATPTITDKDEIRLNLVVDCSEVDFKHAVTLNNATVPGVSRRRVHTQLELKDGQTVVIGGLVSSEAGSETTFSVAVTAEIIQPLNLNSSGSAPELLAHPQPITEPTLK